MSGPSTKPVPHALTAFAPPMGDEEHVRAGLDEVDSGETVGLTPAELERWATTGELPEHVEQWAGLDSSSSRDVF